MRLAIALLFALTPLAVAAEFEDVTITTTPVSGSIFMMQGAGGNLAVSVGEDGVVLIDDQFAPLSERILAAIAELSDKPVSFVINTHWHFDHTGGNENLGAHGSTIIAHENVRERMSRDGHIKALDYHVPASPESALPVITFNDRATIHFNGEAITAYHTPGAHTDGDSIIHFPDSNVIHMGDDYFNGSYPFIDRSSGGSVQGLIDAVQKGLGLCTAGTQVIPGHGPLTNCAGLESYGQMVADAAGKIQNLIDQGMTLEQVIAARPTAATDEELGKGFIKPEQFVMFIHQSLTE